MRIRRAALHRAGAMLGAGVLASGALAACTAAPADEPDGKLRIVAGAYPLQFAVQQVGGSHVTVGNLTKPGVEPHDVELTAKQLGTVVDADLVVYSAGISAAVDDAVRSEASGRSFDVNPAAALQDEAQLEQESDRRDKAEAEHDHDGQDHTAGDDHAHDDHAEEDHADEGAGHEGEDDHAHAGHDHDHGALDPHFWLDPGRYAAVGQAIADRLSQADPAHRSDYQANARSFSQRLNSLRTSLVTGLADCRQKDFVTGHAAFGYLGALTGLHQIPITGISPGQEPEGAALSRIADLVQHQGISTIYTETLASPEFANTIARSTGAKTAVLDPVEGITDASAGDDYFTVMRANLATLQKGQDCP